MTVRRGKTCLFQSMDWNKPPLWLWAHEFYTRLLCTFVYDSWVLHPTIHCWLDQTLPRCWVATDRRSRRLHTVVQTARWRLHDYAWWSSACWPSKLHSPVRRLQPHLATLLQNRNRRNGFHNLTEERKLLKRLVQNRLKIKLLWLKCSISRAGLSACRWQLNIRPTCTCRLNADYSTNKTKRKKFISFVKKKKHETWFEEIFC